MKFFTNRRVHPNKDPDEQNKQQSLAQIEQLRGALTTTEAELRQLRSLLATTTTEATQLKTLLAAVEGELKKIKLTLFISPILQAMTDGYRSQPFFNTQEAQEKREQLNQELSLGKQALNELTPTLFSIRLKNYLSIAATPTGNSNFADTTSLAAFICTIRQQGSLPLCLYVYDLFFTLLMETTIEQINGAARSAQLEILLNTFKNSNDWQEKKQLLFLFTQELNQDIQCYCFLERSPTYNFQSGLSVVEELHPEFYDYLANIILADCEADNSVYPLDESEATRPTI
jgi:hypothetical protein